jgi:hypothetical protein
LTETLIGYCFRKSLDGKHDGKHWFKKFEQIKLTTFISESINNDDILQIMITDGADIICYDWFRENGLDFNAIRFSNDQHLIPDHLKLKLSQREIKLFL